jgi:hypothetical protein
VSAAGVAAEPVHGSPPPPWLGEKPEVRPHLDLGESLDLDRFARKGVRALTSDELSELRGLVRHALHARRGRERLELTLDQRITLRGLRQAADAEQSRRRRIYEATPKPPRQPLLDENGQPVDERDPVAVRRAVGLKWKREAEARRRFCEQRDGRAERAAPGRAILRPRIDCLLPDLLFRRIALARSRGVAQRTRSARRSGTRSASRRKADPSARPAGAAA